MCLLILPHEQMYRKGDGVQKDEAKSEEYKKKALDMQEQFKQQAQLQFQQGTAQV